jgi:hypothetical protein
MVARFSVGGIPLGLVPGNKNQTKTFFPSRTGSAGNVFAQPSVTNAAAAGAKWRNAAMTSPEIGASN